MDGLRQRGTRVISTKHYNKAEEEEMSSERMPRTKRANLQTAQGHFGTYKTPFALISALHPMLSV